LYLQETKTENGSQSIFQTIAILTTVLEKKAFQLMAAILTYLALIPTSNFMISISFGE